MHKTRWVHKTKNARRAGWIWACTFACAALTAAAQQPSVRVFGNIDSAQQVTVQGSESPLVRASVDQGSVPPETTISGASIVFSRSSDQEASLKALIAAQQTPSSKQYHQWLTPEQFAASYGLADTDLAKVEAWLEQQGFTVGSVSRSRNRITFSGTTTLVERAFGTGIHTYRKGDTSFYAPSSSITVPAALSSVVQSVSNLSSLRPRAYVRFKSAQAAAQPAFTSSQSGSHYLTPGDIATIYDVAAAYNAGYTGTGQSIAVVGQSAISVVDVEHFQSAIGMTVKDPELVLVPSSGAASTVTGDEAESDLDTEYSGAIAKGAKIYLVYVGASTNYSVYDSVQYAVDTLLAPIISISYGTCETELSASDYASLNGVLEQAAAQGQSVIAASGDDGSTACYGDTALTTAQQQAVAVSFPASSQYVTAVGGTEFSSADVSSSNTQYWKSANGTDDVSSALSYIPEQVWNDDSSTNGLSSGGGGASTLTSRPSWQVGVSGIAAGSYRLVPDIALSASPDNAGYLYCSSDSTSTGITGSCSNGLRDSSNLYLTVAGGTSFDAPLFAGLLAIINQKQNSTGQGVAASTLYTLGATPATYASAFHDVTSGNNECTAGTTYCSSAGQSVFSAGVGYDEASGLGSIDFYNLLLHWPSSSGSALTSSTTTLAASSATPSAGVGDPISITVAPTESGTSITTTPTGTITVTVDGAVQSPKITLSGGSATYTFSSTSSGSHVVTASYSGDASYAASTGSVTLAVAGSSSTGSSQSFTLAATNLSVSRGSSGSSTITITSNNGYAGTLSFALSTSSSSLQTYGCYEVSNTAVGANATATTSLTIYTSESLCNGSSSAQRSNRHSFARRKNGSIASASRATPFDDSHLSLSAAAISGFLLIGCISFPLRLRVVLPWILLVSGLAMLSGCGSSSSSSTAAASSTEVASGTYSLVVVGTDTANSGLTAQTAFTLTVN